MDQYDVDASIRDIVDELLGKMIEEIGIRLRHHSPTPAAAEALRLVVDALETTRVNLAGRNG